MRIVHVVTLLTPDGAFGGPARVAVNQATALRERGHDVEIIAGSRGYGGKRPALVGSVPVHLFPARQLVPGAGFSGLAAPGLARWTRRHLNDVDVLHIHCARDLITLPFARWALARDKPYVLQPHGMIKPSDKALSRPLDALLTRPVLHGASTVFYLTAEEHKGLESVARGRLERSELLENGVPPADVERSQYTPREVLFMARLQERKRPLAFVSMASRLLSEGSDASFSLVGPDEGEGPTVRAAIDRIASKQLTWQGPLPPEATLQRLARASLYVLPSVDEPYPMAVLEALSVGCPVVVTESCGLAPAIRQLGCGLVVNESTHALEDGVRALLNDPVRLTAMGKLASFAASERFDMHRVVDRLEASYRLAD